MNRDYYSGLPYSDELYHHGIKGQKWGIRRYQYEDGTRTPEGRKHYGYADVTDKLKTNLKKAAKSTGETLKKIGKATGKELATAGKAMGNAAKKIGKSAVKAYKKKHPSLMNDEELIAFKKRLDLERSYKDALADMKKKSFIGRTENALEDIVKQSATKLAVQTADKAAQTLANRLFESDAKKEQRKYEELIAADKAKRNWETKEYIKDKDEKSNDSKNSKDKKRDGIFTYSEDNKPKDKGPITKDNPIQKAIDVKKQAELDRNKAEAEKGVKKILEEREKTKKIFEEIDDQKRKKQTSDFIESISKNTLPSSWEAFNDNRYFDF